MFSLSNFSEPLDWWGWSSTGTIELDNLDASDTLDNDCSTLAMSSALENAGEEHVPPTIMFKDPRRNFRTLGSPILHQNLVGKFETLLNMCKNLITVMIWILLTQGGRRSKILCHPAEWRRS